MLHSVGLDALATANDMNRNVLCTSNPYESQLHAEAYEWAKRSLSICCRVPALMPDLAGSEKVATTDEEPILGQTYLPRKFKTTVVIPPQNDIDLHANDMNFVAIAENGKLVGFNLLVGGGLSIEHGNKNLRPHGERIRLSAAGAYAGGGGSGCDHPARLGQPYRP